MTLGIGKFGTSKFEMDWLLSLMDLVTAGSFDADTADKIYKAAYARRCPRTSRQINDLFCRVVQDHYKSSHRDVIKELRQTFFCGGPYECDFQCCRP